MVDETKPDVTKEIPKIDLSDSIREFARDNSDYYVDSFSQIQSSDEKVTPWNLAAMLFGPAWCAARGLWNLFWLFTIAELVALVQIGRGLWGDLGADKLAEAEQLIERAQDIRLEGGMSGVVGDETVQSAVEIAINLERAAEVATLQAHAAASFWWAYLVVGIALFGLLRYVMGKYAK